MTSAMLDPLYVVDTHPLIWYLSNKNKLSAFAKSIFTAAEQNQTYLVVSAIVIAEMYYADKKWNLFADFAQVYRQLRAEPYLQFVNFKPDDVMDFSYHSAVPEMHDRIIVGLALRLNVPLITVDSVITASGIVSVAW